MSDYEALGNVHVKFYYDNMMDLWRIRVTIPEYHIYKPTKLNLKDFDGSCNPETAVEVPYENIPSAMVGGNISNEALYHGGYTALQALFENAEYEHPVVSKSDIAWCVIQAAKAEAGTNYKFLSGLTNVDMPYGENKPTKESIEKMLLESNKLSLEVKTGRDLPLIMPGLYNRVKHPERDKFDMIFYIIQDLNDHYEWSREKVADWLDTLDVDLSFPIEESDG